MITEKEITLEDYIITIYRLEKLEGLAKTTLIAKELLVTPATVSKVIEHLELKGFAKRIKYKGVMLTRKGKKLAREIIKKHRVLEIFLHEYLGFDWIESHYLAHHLEHIPSVVAERILQRFIRERKFCPHGNPLDDLENKRKTISLFNGVLGKMYRIVRIKSELRFILKEIDNVKLGLGEIVQLLKKGDKVELKKISDGKTVEISIETAKALCVEEVNVKDSTG